MTKRLEALSTTKFGSQNSGINRTALTVPNSNTYDRPGSNPLWQDGAEGLNPVWGPEIDTQRYEENIIYYTVHSEDYAVRLLNLLKILNF